MKFEFSLKEIQLRLNIPQHVLIHLCEKGVITAEIEETKGRGLKRKFSKKNLFEFAIASELRKFEVPITLIKAIIITLSAFQKSVRKELSSFTLPDSLLTSPINISLHIYNGDYLVFDLSGKSFIGFDLRKLSKDSDTGSKSKKLLSLPEKFRSHLELNLFQIASDNCQ